jgi:menaquinone-9 beta-reductase
VIRIRPAFDADVLVVGGGPAGAATAAHLASEGVSVLVVDAQRFPRDKVCGDFVGPAALRELRDLGGDDGSAFGAGGVIRRAAVHIDGQRVLTRPFPAARGLPAYGRVIPRAQLDHWLLETAVARGARLLEGARVVGFERQG